ncbi:MAG: dihydrolipoamide acetyltransferase family protein [Prolixibacteraceae bacterium]
MSEFKVQMPKLGESVQEATITKWFIKEGDKVEEDDALFEVATEKVDSEIPSPVEGIISKILYKENDLVPVGEIVAIIKMEDEDTGDQEERPADEEIREAKDTEKEEKNDRKEEPKKQQAEKSTTAAGNPEVSEKPEQAANADKKGGSGRFYSPLVMNIAREENISFEELESISGSGENGRVQKKDVLQYLEDKKQGKAVQPEKQAKAEQPAQQASQSSGTREIHKAGPSFGATDQIVEMDRVRKIIAERMVESKKISAHVTSVVEADVTNLVLWRNRVKEEFLSKYGEKLTFMPVFTEATAQALTEFPLVNASVEGDKIHFHKNVNIGIAVAKPDGNLVVPVIREAEQKNLLGLTKTLNGLADGARKNKLGMDDFTGGTFSITNFGTFRNIIGTPIINQPQVAILATGSIEKKPAVMETLTGDVIVVRHKMFLSLTYDHRIIDGALGGAFLRRIADILEEFDINRAI